jgi:hypothetical protein
MHLIRIGGTIINLDRVTSIDMDAERYRLDGSAKARCVAVIYGSGYNESYDEDRFFDGEAEQLRAFFAALSTTDPTDYPYEVLDVAGVVAEAEAKRAEEVVS